MRNRMRKCQRDDLEVDYDLSANNNIKDNNKHIN